MANTVWRLSKEDKKFYICTTNKNGAALIFNVEGRTLRNMISYLLRHFHFLAPFLARYTTDPALCMGPERIAKRLLNTIKSPGTNMDIFKVHSLRAATTAHLLTKGVTLDLVQRRGHWTTSHTMDMYYSRMHQHKAWQAFLLGEDDAGRQSAECGVPPPTDPLTDQTKEGESGGFEEGSTSQTAKLYTQGVLRLVNKNIVCPTCGRKMKMHQ